MMIFLTLMLFCTQVPADTTGPQERPALEPGAVQGAPDDPESTAKGRKAYLGREVARTMHWRGANWLLRETRENEENGKQLREWLGIQPGMGVADLGCGNGYHTLPIAASVGDEGRVFAVDLQPEMLVLLAERAGERGLGSFEPIVATVDDPKLPKASCDLVLMVDVYHELSHPVRVLERVKAALRPGGELVLVEFRTEDKAVPIKRLHRMTKAQMVAEMAANGLVLTRETDELPWQHAMAFGLARGAPSPAVPASQPMDPRLEAREMLRGFVAAMSRLDPRIVEPFLAEDVDVGDADRLTPRELSLSIAQAMRGSGPPIPAGTRFELRAGPDGTLLGKLDPSDAAPILADRREVQMRRDAAGVWRVAAWREPSRPSAADWPFAVMDTARLPGEADAQAQAARTLGFDGATVRPGDVEGQRRSHEAVGMDVHAVYHEISLEDHESLQSVLASIDALAGGPGMVWLAVRSAGEAGDESAAEALARPLGWLLSLAGARDVDIALYPHAGFRVASHAEALEVVRTIDDPRLGIVFNLCHFLREGDPADPAPLLALAKEKLFAVTVSGANVDGESWSELIQPLDSGDFDLGALIDDLETSGFDGPVGLQCYGVPGPAADHLRRSIEVWRRLTAD